MLLMKLNQLEHLLALAMLLVLLLVLLSHLQGEGNTRLRVKHFYTSVLTTSDWAEKQLVGSRKTSKGCG